MRTARNAARSIGWIFVALIGIHAVRAASQAERAASDGHWAHAGELLAIAIVATALVIGAVVNFEAIEAAGTTPLRPPTANL